MKKTERKKTKYLIWHVDLNGRLCGRSTIKIEETIGSKIIDQKVFSIPNGCLGIIGEKML